MRYDEAFKIGSKVEGYVKCTYAMLHLPEFGKLFSIQGTQHRSNWRELAEPIGKVKPDETAFLIAEAPIVIATERVQYKPNEWVPVQLTKECMQAIISKIFKPNYWETKYTITRVWLKEHHTTVTKWEDGKPVNRDVLLNKVFGTEKIYEGFKKPDLSKYEPTQDTEVYGIKYGEIEKTPNVALRAKILGAAESGDIPAYFYRVESKRVVGDAYYALIDGIKNGATFYVKPQAIDWVPVDVNNATVLMDGVELNLDDALALAYKKMQDAKHLCLAAGLTTLI